MPLFETLGLRLRRPRPGRGGGYPENAAPIKAVARLAEPFGSAVARALDVRFGHGLDGRGYSGRGRDVRGSDKGGPQFAYRGYLPSLQGFTGAAWMPLPVPAMIPSPGQLRPGLNQVLPGTNAVPSAVRQLIANRLLEAGRNAPPQAPRGDV